MSKSFSNPFWPSWLWQKMWKIKGFHIVLAWRLKIKDSEMNWELDVSLESIQNTSLGCFLVSGARFVNSTVKFNGFRIRPTSTKSIDVWIATCCELWSLQMTRTEQVHPKTFRCRRMSTSSLTFTISSIIGWSEMRLEMDNFPFVVCWVHPFFPNQFSL